MVGADTAGSADARPRRGALHPIELTDAAVLGGVTLVLCLVGWFLPHATVASVLAAVPMAVLAQRHRPRAVVASAVAASAVGFLVAGTGPVSSVVACALAGGVAGHARRQGWGHLRTLGAIGSMVPPVALLADGLLAVLSRTRKLSLLQLTNTWHGVASLLRHVPLVDRGVPTWTRFLADAVRWWWISIPMLVGAGLIFTTFLAWIVAGALVERLERVAVGDSFGVAAADGPPDPLPADLHDVTYRYPAASSDALSEVNLTIEPGTFSVVVGPNGSGKSTLGRVLAGLAPTAGTVDRPGQPGLGQPNGTAIIMQRPETQVLGVRVIDDVTWGLGADDPVDPDALLRTVGLDGMGQRATATLSGGELQRLAIAAALGRRPRLLISDESTAMVDHAGREVLTALLARLPQSEGLAVVHISHRPEEALAADQIIALADGRRVECPIPAPAGPSGHSSFAHWCGGTGADMELVGIGHVWADGTPWRQRALADIDLHVGAGDGVVVLGGNGSGKSTLAWILAGLIVPSEGSCLLGGRPMDTQVGAVGLAFQHARLQLLRPTVAADVRSAGGVGPAEAERALELMDLDPATVSDRSVDELSGGEMRRVAIAGLLARVEAKGSRVLVLDEPLAGLDQDSRASLLDVLGHLRAEIGLTLVVVSHDVEGIGECCDRVVRLHQGRVVADEPLTAAWP